MEKLNFTLAEKTALRAVLTGKSVSSAAEANGLSDRAVESAFERFQRAMIEVMRDSGKRFAENSLASSSPLDIYDLVMQDLGYQTWDDFDDTAPDYFEKQAEKRLRERQDSQKLSVWESLLEEMANQVMLDLGWQTDEDFNDLAPDYLEKQGGSRIGLEAHSSTLEKYEVSDAYAESMGVINEAINAALAANPAVKANDDLRIALDDAATGLADVMEGMPAEQRRAFVDAAIADWLADNAEAIRKASETNE